MIRNQNLPTYRSFFGFLFVRIKIKTSVKSSLQEIKNGFTQDLFLKLNPPFPPVRLLRFDGCEAGDQVVLELNFLLFKQQWVSNITEDSQKENEWYFIDKGTKLPFFLKKWTHRHIVESKMDGAEIIDDIRFSTGTILSDILFYPALLGQFMYRKPIYKKVFSQ